MLRPPHVVRKGVKPRAHQAAHPRLLHRHARLGDGPAVPVRVRSRHPRLGRPHRGTAPSTLFSVGALVAAPFGGRLSDRFNPVTVAVLAKLLAAVGVGSPRLGRRPRPPSSPACSSSASASPRPVPAESVLVLRWTSSDDRRKVFAYKFTGEALGMAVGAFVAGQFVDLDRTDGMDCRRSSPRPRLRGLGGCSSHVAGHRRCRSDLAPELAAGRGRLRLSTRAVPRASSPSPRSAGPRSSPSRSPSASTRSSSRACRPTPSPCSTSTRPTIGLAAAVNCVVIVALQVSSCASPPSARAGALLMAVGGIWVVAWLVLSAAAVRARASPSALFVMTFGIFAVGETMYAPVLNPLTASLAPRGPRRHDARAVHGDPDDVLGARAARRRRAARCRSVDGFLGLHLALSVLAVFAACGLKRVLAALRVRHEPPTPPVEVVDPVDA